MQKITDAKVRMHKGRPLLTLPHVQDRNAAEALRGTSIFIARKDLPDIDDHEAYLHDIIGLEVLDAETHESIGFLESVEFPSDAQMIWCIKAKGGQEILLPAVEEFIIKFDIDAGIILVSPPPGLIELYMNKDHA